MKNETELMTRVESKPALGNDWVDAHADYLFNFAIGQVRDPSVAEDLVQDTFLAAVKAQNSFGGKSSERPGALRGVQPVRIRFTGHAQLIPRKGRNFLTTKSAKNTKRM